MNNWSSFYKICFITSTLMFLVLFWDISVLHLDPSNLGYILVKGTTILGIYFLSFFTWKRKTVPLYFIDIYGILFYSYSLYGMVYLDMTYSFAFIEAFFVISLGMRTTGFRFILVSLYGLIGSILGHYYATEPAFVAAGQSYKHHSFTVTFLLFMIAVCIHFFVTRYQAQIMELNEKFAMIGKQSSFLMHEIKTPLGRVMANSEGENFSEDVLNDIRRDSQKISALVSSVETLIQNPESFHNTFTMFEWREVQANIELDFNSYLASMNIRCGFENFEESFYGNKHLMYQLLRNLIVNAIEAIGFKNDETSEIALTLKRNDQNFLLKIRNTNSQIPSKHLEDIFTPHFTTKKNATNKGLGLALVKSIVEAHGGKIKAHSNPQEVTFEIQLPIKDLNSQPT